MNTPSRLRRPASRALSAALIALGVTYALRAATAGRSQTNAVCADGWLSSVVGGHGCCSSHGGIA